jgi:zinc transport system permease protein
VHSVFRREFLFAASDAETARTLGMNAPGWDLLLMLTIGGVVALSMKLTGMLFVFASLVIPGLTGLALFNRVAAVLACSVGVASAAVLLGFAASFRADLPTSPTIICFYALFYLAASGWKSLARRRPRHGA